MKLSIYWTVALSVLFTLACSKVQEKSVIASIAEASGIDYCEDSNTLIVANDEGTMYEMTLNGTIVSEHTLGKYDLEGVICEEETFVFAVEDKGLLLVNRKSFKNKLLKLKGKKFKLSKKSGIEGITKIKEDYLLAIQSKGKEKSVLIRVSAGANYAKIKEIYHHGIVDSSGLAYKENRLYIVSDKKNMMYVYNLKKGKVIQKIKLDKFAQEGIAFGKDNFVYFADDNGGVRKYSHEELRIK